MEYLLACSPNHGCSDTCFAGVDKLCGAMIVKEFAAASEDTRVRLLSQYNTTVNWDGWSDRKNHSIYLCNASCSDGEVFVIDCRDLSDISHTGENISGKDLPTGAEMLVCCHSC